MSKKMIEGLNDDVNLSYKDFKKQLENRDTFLDPSALVGCKFEDVSDVVMKFMKCYQNSAVILASDENGDIIVSSVQFY